MAFLRITALIGMLLCMPICSASQQQDYVQQQCEKENVVNFITQTNLQLINYANQFQSLVEILSAIKGCSSSTCNSDIYKAKAFNNACSTIDPISGDMKPLVIKKYDSSNIIQRVKCRQKCGKSSDSPACLDCLKAISGCSNNNLIDSSYQILQYDGNEKTCSVLCPQMICNNTGCSFEKNPQPCSQTNNLNIESANYNANFAGNDNPFYLNNEIASALTNQNDNGIKDSSGNTYFPIGCQCPLKTSLDEINNNFGVGFSNENSGGIIMHCPICPFLYKTHNQLVYLKYKILDFIYSNLVQYAGGIQEISNALQGIQSNCGTGSDKNNNTSLCIPMNSSPQAPRMSNIYIPWQYTQNASSTYPDNYIDSGENYCVLSDMNAQYSQDAIPGLLLQAQNVLTQIGSAYKQDFIACGKDVSEIQQLSLSNDMLQMKMQLLSQKQLIGQYQELNQKLGLANNILSVGMVAYMLAPDSVHQFVNGIKTAIAKGIESGVQKFGNAINDGIKKGFSVFENNVKKLGAVLDKARLSPLEEKVAGNIEGEFTQNLQDTFKTIESETIQEGSSLGEQAAAGSASLESSLTEVGTLVENMTESLESGAVEAADDALQNISKAAENIALNAAEDIGEALT